MPPKNTPAATAAGGGAEIADKYRTHTHEEHILELPDTYIGSTEPDEIQTWIRRDGEVAAAGDGDHHLTQETIRQTPGFYKVFDEVLVNAVDQFVRLRQVAGRGETVAFPVRKIRVTVDAEKGEISVMNDGNGIDVVEHPQHKLWVPQLIFGTLLSSSNYDKGEEKFTGGKNGQGAKLANIFATEFTVETIDHVRKLSFKMTWRDNMKTVGRATVRACDKVPFTRITWKPELARFGMTAIDADTVALLRRRTQDVAAWCGRDVAVTWNGKRVECRDLTTYAKLHLTAGAKLVVVEKARWRVAVAPSDGQQQVSFVNGINTHNGGRHVDYVLKAVTDGICALAKKKHKATLKPQYVRENLFLFVIAEIVNPSFKSQTKEELTTPVARFGSAFALDGKEIDRIAKTGILDAALRTLESKENVAAKKTDGKKTSRITGVPKLEDATWAGTRKSAECTLILTEGDSAATTAISGLKVIGRERFGVFPLKGKILNVRDASKAEITKNEEITNIKKILGLKEGRVQESLADLRQGRIMLLTDQDLDGSHIKGLGINLIHALWPGLLRLGFVASMATPIMKATRGGAERTFFSQQEYDAWKTGAEATTGRWAVKQQKGLGTSSPKEAREYFKTMLTQTQQLTPACEDRVPMAFQKDRANDRKDWLRAYDEDVINDFARPEISCAEFVDKELIHFSNQDNLRSIPSVMDGLKPSLRKILWSAFKRNLVSEIKVAQLAGYVSEHSGQHHGEASLTGAITAMAQNFVASNNINLLLPNGQFGSRLMGGKDSASPRQIFTALNPISSIIQRKEDSPLLTYVDDDGAPVEPKQQEPVVPMLLINGSKGIGTGFSTEVPPQNPLEVVAAVRQFIADPDAELPTLMPFWLGHRGELVELGDGTFVSLGKWERTADCEVTITELPAGVWTKDYREFLEKQMERGDLWQVDDEQNDVDVRFVLRWRTEQELDDAIQDGKARAGVDVFATKFKLQKTQSVRNMYAFSPEGELTKYASPAEIIQAWGTERRLTQMRRREHQLGVLAGLIRVAENRQRFIAEQVAGTLDLRRMTDDAVASVMRERRFWEDPAKVSERDVLAGWQQLLGMPVRSFTERRLDELRQEKERQETEQAELSAMSAEDLWLRDLLEFETAQGEMVTERQRYQADARAEAKEGAAGGGAGAKKVRRRRKAPVAKA